MKPRLWHLSLFVARFGLIGIIMIYLWLAGGVAEGGLNLTGIALVIAAYLFATTLVGILSRGNELGPRLRGSQTILDAAALAIGAPHDPSAAMPVLFYLAITPLEFGVRYGSASYRFSVLCTLIATGLIVAARTNLFPMGMALEAYGLLLLTWAAIAYGLITVYGMHQLRGQTARAEQRVDLAAAAAGMAFWRLDLPTRELTLDTHWRHLIGYPMAGPEPGSEEGLATVHPHDRAAFLERLNEAISADRAFTHDYRAVHMQTGAIGYHHIRSDIERDAQGRPVAMNGIILDVSDAQRRRQELDALRENHERAMRAAGIGHWSFDLAEQSAHIDNVLADDLLELQTGEFDQSMEGLINITFPEDRPLLNRAIEQGIATGEEQNFRHRRLLPDGNIRWLQTRGKVQFDDQGRPAQILGATWNITDLVEAETALAEARERYDHGMRIAGVGHFMIDLDARTVDFDAIFSKDVLQIQEDEFHGDLDELANLVVPEDRAVQTRAIEQTIATGEEQHFIQRRRLPDGSILWVEIRGRAQFDANGQATHIIGAGWDVTYIMQLTEALEHSNRELDDFAYIASHDLREPLRGLHNYAKFLDEDYRDKLDDEGRHMLSSLGRLAQRLDDLISDLLHFSRVGRTELAITKTDVDAVLRDVLETLAFSLEQQGIEMRIPEPLPTLRCDRVRVGELLRNLITNAAKYNDNDDKWIEVGYANGVFHVSDNGIGIAPEHHDKVFTIFKRLHGRDRFGGGTGAGLTIVERIVQRHGGKIWLQSEPGAGTTFLFTLGQASGENNQPQASEPMYTADGQQ